MKIACSALGMFILVGAVLADETNLNLTVNGVTYSNVTFGTVRPATVVVRHRTGAATILLAILPPDLQQRFGYDPQRAADWQAAKQKAAADRAKTEKERAEVIAKSVLKKGKIIKIWQLGEQGVLLQTYRHVSARYSANDYDVEENVIFVAYPRCDKVADGDWLSFYGYQDGTWETDNGEGSHPILQRWVYVSDRQPKK